MESDGADKKSNRPAVVAPAGSALLASLGVSVANVALPAIAADLRLSVGAAQWVVIAYLLAMTISVVTAGRLGDLFGHRRLFLAGAALFTAASVLCGLAPGFGALLAARAAQGSGAAILIALSLPLIRDSAAPSRVGQAIGLIGTTSAIGTALGPTVGGLLVAGLGWRAVFLALVMPGLIVLVAAMRNLAPAAPATGTRKPLRASAVDLPGAGLLALALAAFTLAIAPTGFGPSTSALLLVGALTGLAMFFRAESRHPQPLVRVATLAHPAVAKGLAINAIVASVMMSTLVVGPFYLAGPGGLHAAAVGLALGVGPGLAILTGLPAGRLVDRLGTDAVVRLGLVCMAAGTFGLAVLPGLFGVLGYLAAIAVLTSGYQLVQAANGTALMQVAPDGQRGVISGLVSLSRNVGLLSGASVLGAVFVRAAAGDDVLAGVVTTNLVALALVAVAITLTLRRPLRAYPAAAVQKVEIR
ncbi:MAG: MFS transporter [Paracoccaceae bacterium]